MKPLLPLLLVAMQLLAGGASPCWLCIDRDGTISVALGPDDCSCPHHVALRATDLVAELPSNEAGQSSRIFGHRIDCCGCLHIELAHEQAPAVERASASDRLLTAVAAASTVPLVAGHSVDIVSHSSGAVWMGTALPLRADLGSSLSTIVLRL